MTVASFHADRDVVNEASVTDDGAARIAELEAKLARASHERDEYRKLYELVLLEPI